MSSSSFDTVRDVASSLSPPAVSQYLASKDWQLEFRDGDVREVWRLPGEDSARGRVMVPLATDYVDFQRRFRESLLTIAAVYGWDVAQLAERISATRADCLFVRFDQEMVDGTIPFRQAEASLEALYTMMKAVATTADDPGHSHRGRRSAIVTNYLDEDLRLGHTMRGSFVFTVVSRLGVDDRSATDMREPFPRRVMSTLAQGLASTRTLAAEWDESALDRAAELGLSAGLVESVLDLTQPSEVRALDLAFDWAAAVPPREGLGSRVVLDRDIMAGLPRVRERLVRREEPARRIALMGIVRSLERGDGEGDDEVSSIVLATEVDGRRRRVQVPLTAEDYDCAIRAHQTRLPIGVTGDLVFERGAWRMTGSIAIDSQFLDRHS